MYDVYGARPNNMGFSETTDFVKGTNFVRPNHRAVTYLTKEELNSIVAYWKLDLEALPPAK